MNELKDFFTTEHITHLVEHYSAFGPFFLLISLPFTPSFILNGFTAISRVKTASYLLASILGKFIMILTISYIGNDNLTLDIR